jgi:hypothetical protein
VTIEEKTADEKPSQLTSAAVLFLIAVGKTPDTAYRTPGGMPLIVSSYVQRERVSEQMNEQYPNTFDIDGLFFANEDPFSDVSLNVWWSKIPPEYQQVISDAVEEERSVTHEDFKQNKGRPLTAEETNMINDCFDIVESGGPTALSDFVKQCPLAQENGMMQIISSIIYSKAIWRE